MSAQSMSENEIEQFKGLFIAMKPHLELMRRGQLPEELARKFCQTLGLEWFAGLGAKTMQQIAWYLFVSHDSVGAFIDGYDSSGPADAFMAEVDTLLQVERATTTKYNEEHPEVMEKLRELLKPSQSLKSSVESNEDSKGGKKKLPMEMKDDAGEVVTEEKIFEKLAKGEIALTRRRGHDDPEKQYYCPQCGKGFPSRDAVADHVKRSRREHLELASQKKAQSQQNQLQKEEKQQQLPLENSGGIAPTNPNSELSTKGRRPLMPGDQPKFVYLEDIISAGIIPVGAVVELDGQSGVCSGDGTIHVGKITYATPTSWATDVRGDKSSAWQSITYMGKPLQEYKVMFAKLRNAITGSKKNPRRPADEAEEEAYDVDQVEEEPEEMATEVFEVAEVPMDVSEVSLKRSRSDVEEPAGDGDDDEYEFQEEMIDEDDRINDRKLKRQKTND